MSEGKPKTDLPNSPDSSADAMADTMDSGERKKAWSNSEADTQLFAKAATMAKEKAEEKRRDPARTTEDIVGTVLNGRYLVTKKIGQGGMGAVYEAKHSLIHKRVALKVLLDKHADKDEVVARLKQEARLASSIGHKNIIDITDFGTTENGRTFVVMEFLDGESLGACIAREGYLDSRRALLIAIQVAGALAAAHEKGIVHRDIKPENIFLVDRDGADFVKVVDFGISKSMGQQEDDLRLTQTGMVLGTPLYMSPEQARGDEDLDHRIDIYALGVLLYETLTGEVPFKGKNYLSILTLVASEEPVKPSEIVPGIHRDLESVIMKAMAKDREERYQSMTELLVDLNTLDESDLRTTGARITATRWRNKKERRPLQKYLLGFTGVVAVAGASVLGVNALMSSAPTDKQPVPVAIVPTLDAAPQVATPILLDAALPSPEVRITINSKPAGVTIFNGARQLCEKTPCDIVLPKVDRELTLRGELVGYGDGMLPLTPTLDDGKTLNMTLKKLPKEKGGGRRPNRKKPPETQPEKPTTPTKTPPKNGDLKANPFPKAGT